MEKQQSLSQILYHDLRNKGIHAYKIGCPIFFRLKRRPLSSSAKKKGIRYSRKLHCYYGEMLVTFDGVPVKLFFCRRGKHGSWKGLLATNTDLDFFKAYEIYAMRWSIEVCFAEMKGLLNLGKCQARNFTEQIASVSLCALQYNILGYIKRFDSYETIGGLFADITSGTKELSIVEKIWLLIVEVVTSIAEQISADYDELMSSAINGNKHLKCYLTRILQVRRRLESQMLKLRFQDYTFEPAGIFLSLESISYGVYT